MSASRAREPERKIQRRVVAVVHDERRRAALGEREGGGGGYAEVGALGGGGGGGGDGRGYRRRGAIGFARLERIIFGIHVDVEVHVAGALVGAGGLHVLGRGARGGARAGAVEAADPRALAGEGHAVQDASLPDLAVARSFAVVHRAEVLGVLGRAPASARARVAVRADVILRIVHVLHHASEAHERAGGDVVHAHGVDLGDARHDAGTRERLVEARSNAPVGVLGGRAGGCGGVEEFGHRPEGIQHALRERGRHRECFGERGCARATLDLAGRATPTAVLFEDARARTARSCPPGIRSAACLAFAPDELYLLKWWWARPRGCTSVTPERA